jgi:2',3'-cyclic-nucleotide 2'-phosphodiesterase (5'-nucleotidase family)
MTLRNKYFKIPYILFASLMVSGCAKYTTIANKAHQGYVMDQQMKVDSSVVRYYLPYKAKMEQQMNTVIGQSARELTKDSKPETLLGNFFADALLKEGRKLDKTIDFSFGTKGGLRTNIPKGDVTVSHIFELMPFENELIVVKLKGEGMISLLNVIASRSGLPVSGLTMKIKEGKPTAVMIGGEPFDLNQEYRMLTYDYLSNGGDGLTFLAETKDKMLLNLKVREALLDYVKDIKQEGKTINTQLDGRIVIE